MQYVVEFVCLQAMVKQWCVWNDCSHMCLTRHLHYIQKMDWKRRRSTALEIKKEIRALIFFKCFHLNLKADVLSVNTLM